MKLKNGLLFVLFVSAFLLMPACARDHLCDFCERPIHTGMKATANVDGKGYDACCISCAMTARAHDKKGVMDSVTDHSTNRILAPQAAIYVQGSNVHPCGAKEKAIRDEHSAAFERYDRCEPSIIAFGDRQNATKFQAEHGGKLMAFQEIETLFQGENAHQHH